MNTAAGPAPAPGPGQALSSCSLMPCSSGEGRPWLSWGSGQASAGPSSAEPQQQSLAAGPLHGGSPCYRSLLPEALLPSLPDPHRPPPCPCAPGAGSHTSCFQLDQPEAGTLASAQAGLPGSLGHLPELPPSFSAQPLAAATPLRDPATGESCPRPSSLWVPETLAATSTFELKRQWLSCSCKPPVPSISPLLPKAAPPLL